MPQGFTQRDTKVTRISVIVIIVALIGGLALYYFTNTRTGSASQNPSSAIEGQESISPTPKISIAIAPDQISAPKAAANTIVTNSLEKYLVFYADKNHNQQKDADESSCNSCKGRPVLVGNQDGGFGPVTNLFTLTMDNSAKINTNKLTEQNLVWGNDEDRGLVIPPTAIGLGDGVADLQIPVWEAMVNVAAVNANVTRAVDEDGTVVYEFSRLIPAMKTAADKNALIWVKFTPVISNDTKYFLTSGTFTATPDGYSIKVNWENAGDALNVLKIDNIEFIIP